MPATSSVTIRTAQSEDTDAIRDIVRAAYAKWVPVISREPLPMKADYERAVREHRIEVMHIGSELVGIIELIVHRDHLWIENIALAPLHQAKGLGRQLLIFAERIAIESRLKEMRMLTNAAFESNVALYRRAGYLVDKCETFMGGTTVYMSKKLKR